jgi:hypothetical protein
VIRRFVNIEEHFAAATDEEIQAIFTHPTFAPSDLAAIKAMANTPLRRKLHAIHQNGRALDPKSIQTAAKKARVSIQVTRGKIVVPTTLNEFRDLVRILDDAYLESMLDGTTVYLTTSKRQLPPRTR